MTDSTERLLEVIDDRQHSIRKVIAPDGSPSDPQAHSDALDIREAVVELRRRGEIIVRREDIAPVHRYLVESCRDPAVREAAERLNRAS